jgi:tetratricopeptide (TPR) repeat protein
MRTQTRFASVLILAVAALAAAGCQRPWFRADTGTSPAEQRQIVDRRLRQADRFLDKGLTDSALASFGLALEVNPRVTQAHMGMGHIYRERGDYEKASRRYEKVTELEPDNARAHYYLGQMKQMMGQVQAAVKAYLQTLTLNPDDPDANRELASAYLQMGNASQAVPYAKAATELDPENQGAWANLAAAYSLEGQHANAVDAYRQALDLGEPAEQLLLGLANSHVQLENYGRAINTLRSLIRRNPSAEAYERLGYAQFKQRQFEKALQNFEQALDEDPEHTAALNGVGVCRMTLYLEGNRQNPRQRQRALEAWRKSVKIRPDQPRIVDLLSRYSRS